jgi:hypothetical protein
MGVQKSFFLVRFRLQGGEAHDDVPNEIEGPYVTQVI